MTRDSSPILYFNKRTHEVTLVAPPEKFEPFIPSKCLDRGFLLYLSYGIFDSLGISDYDFYEVVDIYDTEDAALVNKERVLAIADRKARLEPNTDIIVEDCMGRPLQYLPFNSVGTFIKGVYVREVHVK